MRNTTTAQKLYIRLSNANKRGDFIVIEISQLRRNAMYFAQFMGNDNPREKFFRDLSDETRRIDAEYTGKEYRQKVYDYFKNTATLHELIQFVIESNSKQLTYGYGYFDDTISTGERENWFEKIINGEGITHMIALNEDAPEGAWVEIATYEALHTHNDFEEESLINWDNPAINTLGNE